MLFRALFSRSILISLSVAILIAGALVFAYVDRTVFVPEHMVIIPEQATSETWSSLPNTYSQDLTEYSLYQDFNSNNSAYIDVLSLQELETATSSLEADPVVGEEEAESDGSQTGEETGVVDETSDTEDSDQTEGSSNPTEETVLPPEENQSDNSNEEEVIIEETNTEAESEPAPQEEPVASPDQGVENSEQDPVSFVGVPVLALAEERFPLAQLNFVTTTEEVSETTEVESGTEIEDTTSDESEVGNDVVEVEAVENESQNDQEDIDTNVSGTENDDPLVEDIEDSVANEEIADPEEEAVEELGEEVVIEEPVVVYDPMSDCGDDPDCKMYSTVFDGFAIPEFAPGHFLTAAQVRLSLSAKAKIQNDDLRRYVIEYTYGENPYQVATVIDIEDEISNSINGGYFLVSLDKPASQNDISLLKVRVSYQGDINDLERAYIEGVWLEVTSGTFYEETDPNYLKDSLDYDRDLLLPHFLTLNHPDFDVSLGELPTFNMSYSPQGNFLLRAFNSLFSENQYSLEKVILRDNNGNVVEVPTEIIYHDKDVWSLRFKEQPQKLLPGKYSLELVINENETQYIDSFEFYWGVLAVNTTKTRYFVDEEVRLEMAALTTEGDTICDANLELKIISADNEIFEVPVETSGSCGKNNVTDVPDYLAKFNNTKALGRYTIQLQHKNLAGEVVHKIQDHFVVEEYIPFDIERTAPTRIYPLAAYKVDLNITANRSFTGDIKERMPRGFVLEDDASGAELMTGPDYTELIWRNVTLEEGGKLHLSYTFDAPNISPYMYLLGPLDMDGFRELRQWQIASDALTAIGNFTGTRTVAGTNLNQSASPLQWSTSTVDSFYFTHSTTSNSHRVTIKEDGDYFMSVNLPQNRTDGNNSRTRIGLEVRVNGVAVADGLGRSAYIRNQNAHIESTSHANFLLEGLAEDDYIEVYAEGLTTIDAGDIVNVTGSASMILEYISSSRNVFSATTTRTTNSTNLNQTTAYALQWTESRQDSGFSHSDVTNPENIVIANAGLYLVTINVPLTGDTAQQAVLGRVLLGGVQVSGGILAQGYTQSAANEADGDSSIHWTGFIQTSTSSQVLTITTERDGAAGTSSVTTGFVGSIFIEQLPTTDIIAVSGTQLVSGTNWNPAAASSVQWSTRLAYDSSVYTHSTSSNSHQITIRENGSYVLVYNDALNQTLNRANTTVKVLVNGVAVSGAQTKSHYIRNQSGHNNSSGALMFLLENISSSSVITVTSQEEANNGTVDDTTPALLMLWQKTTLNERPVAPTMYNAPFDNIRFASTTPYFDFSATDPDGSSDIVYEFQISTSSSFTASTTFNSASDSEFTNTASSTDSSPFIEGNKIRLQLTGGDVLIDLSTYYWRVRAKDSTGSNEFGEWSVTQSLTVDMASVVPKWYQTKGGQFESDDLVGSVVAGDGVEVETSINTEMIIAYGDSTNSTPRYRLWGGTSWGTQQDALSVGGTINWVRTAAGIKRDEYILMTLNDSNASHVQVYNGTSSTWSNLVTMTTAVSDDTRRGIAVTYESLSGDAMAVSCTNSANPIYRIWNGSTWSATSSITVSSISACNFLAIASDPLSDEIILVVRDTGSQYEALVWNGSAWTDNRVLGSSAKTAREGMTVAYESSGDQAVIAVSDGLNGNVYYTTWNGVQFSDNAQQQISSASHDFEFGVLKSDPDSDRLALCYIDDDNDITVLRWNGGAWLTYSTGNSDLDGTGNSDLGRPIDCEYETSAGRSGNLMVPYSDTVNSRYQVATDTVSWSGEQTITGIEDSFWVQSERAGDGTIVAVFHDDAVAGDEIESSYWNGTSWSTKQAIIPNPSSILASPYETYDISAERFQYTEGDITTTLIDFDYVPNRTTWGDLSFSTTEPVGTDVTVRIKYTATSTCDSYVSNGVLPGNGTGFDVGSSTIDISSLSTSTYNQICLEATISSFGSDTASLDDWTISWVREPKLNQSAYQWYVNGSFLTPTDAWPSGGTDVSENTALTSNEAVSTGDEIRLRLALEDSNVALPVNSETFKLQYAEGLTCSTDLSWVDVGAVGSTTAIWRGYQNTIVGSDWYSGSWTKRIKLTIDNTLVNDDVTDFPVYVNLDDLPDAFFTNVQSDGDDIRITSSDGVTERPYQLVSISTTTKTGELHFKGTLASTTDTEFYLYYGNATATAYATNATYGSQNVWTSSYSLRYQMGESPAGTSPQFRDSTSNSNDAVARAGMTAGDVMTGKIGSAIDLDGNDGGVFEVPLAYTGTFTASMWWYSSSTGFAIAGPAGANEKMGPWSSPANKIFVRTSTASSDTTVDTPATSTWHHVVLTRDSSNKVDLHINGTTTRLYADVAQSGNSDWENFGGETTQGFIGRMDEIRFASVRRTNGWIQTEFNNQSNSTGFYDVSAEEPISDGRLIPSTILTDSDNPETYEEENPTRDNQNQIDVGDASEWDFVIENNNATANTNYCFRMVYEDGAVLNSYTNYPRLITNSPPLTPTLTAPFDNEEFASTTPWFEFSADDALNDLVSYQIEIDNDYDFSSVLISRESNANFEQFTNISAPSERGIYSPGQTIQFIPNTTIATGTYYWRVKAKDDEGSNTYSSWSSIRSFTVNGSVTITTWLQTTGEQFATNVLETVVESNTNDDVRIATSYTAGTTTSGVIDFDDRDSGNAWGELLFTDVETSGSIDYYVEYEVTEGNFALVPDAVLSGNSSGFNTSPVSLANLNTTTYNELRLVAAFAGNTTFPQLQDWRVTWRETIDVPTILTYFDNAKIGTTTPSFTFYAIDPENHDLQYEFQLSTTSDFAASSTFLSGVAAGFVNTASSTDTSSFISGDTIQYTIQSALTNGTTYWWRVRARDPGGSDLWSEYTTERSFTIDNTITTSIWYQTTGDQFATDDLVDIETVSGGAQITSTLSEVMAVYGEGTNQAPQYTIWDGSNWSTAASAATVGAETRWVELKAAPTRPEYAMATLDTALDINFQIYDANADSWGDVLEMQTNSAVTDRRSFNLAYESTSGDLLAVVCNGHDAVFATWNGTTWSATSSLTLAQANTCEFVQLASDPTSDEIIGVFRHNEASTTDFEALVWNGSSWGNSSAFGDMTQASYEGMAVAYEESGGQAVVVVSDGAANSARILYNTWNGSSWSGTTTHTTGDHIEWATLKSDVGSDQMALCYVDNDSDIGILVWTGSGWGTFSEATTIANDIRGRSVDCEFQVGGTEDGYIRFVYSDTGTTAFYNTYATSSFLGAAVISNMPDTWEMQSVRSGDNTIHVSGFDDGAATDDILASRWTTSWTNTNAFTTNASLDASIPQNGGSSMAAQIYPNITSGSIRSTAIDFNDGTGPRWEAITFSDTTPGASTITYRVYYLASTSVYTLIPNSALAGNSTGFTTSPIDISDLDRTIYETLKIDAELDCVAGNCPSIQDWSVEWAEGINVSGTAWEYDEVSTTTSGTVAVAVNGALQSGKTGTILADGTWSIANVTAFPDDTIMVFVDGAASSSESVAVATYDGVGDVTGMELNKRHLTIGYSSAATTTNTGMIGYDNADDEDIFATISGAGVLQVCAEADCTDARLKIKSGTTYVPGANITTFDLENNGTFAPATNTARISGTWNNAGTFREDTSTIIFTATTSSFTPLTSSTTHSFYNLTVGETSGSSTWTINKPLRVNGNLTVNFGTLARGTSTINLAQNLSIGANGYFSGLATTTFEGSGSYTWSDAKSSASSTNAGYVVIDGTTKTITLAGNVGAESVTIGSDDTLNASGSGFNINVYRNWTNNNSFIPQSGTVTFVGTSTGLISRGTSAFNNLTFSGVGGIWTFSTSTLALNGSLTIATGTVTLPNGTTTIAGSFLNTGGVFQHNNGEVRMTSTSAGRTITQSATALLNAFYDLVFTGSGSWSYSETNATTSRNYSIQSGTVTFPSGQLTIGEDFSVTGTGAFTHNSGEVVFLVQDSDTVRANSSSFNNVRVVGGISSSWYSDSWSYRVPIVVQESQIDGDLTNFPVYVNLDDMGSTFFSNVKSDGGDIRVTQSDGVTEVPREVVSVNTGSTEGEVHFRATSISSTTNSTYYLYFGNSGASDYASTSAYGARNVWSNGYTIVDHMGDLNTSTVLNSTSTINGSKTSANNPLGVTTGKTYGAQDFSADSVQHTGNILSNFNQYNVSMWFNADALTGGNADEQNFGRSLYGISAAGSPYQWLRAGGTVNSTNFTLCAYDAGTVCNVSSGAGLATGAWYHVSVDATKSATTTLRSNGVERLSFTNTGSGVVSTNFTIADLRPARGINFDGRIDEVRVSSVTRTNAWRDAEYRNFSTSTTFYSVSAVEGSRARTFSDTNVTILGNLNLVSGGDATFPTGVLSIGGSFNNDAEFAHSSGTVRFNSTAGSETIEAGSSTFATLEFNGATGDFTVTENATATVAVNLINASQFTLSSGRTLATLGTFSNAVASSSTTWTGSTLSLLNGTTTNMNLKSHGGDIYGTLYSASTTAKMWNSSATTYTTTGTTGSIYSQDHSAVDGDLYIYGNYLRSTGTEYWSHATDFDGTALGTSSARQVDVRVSTSSSVRFASSSLNIVGGASASTSINAQTGAFALSATNTTLTAQYFTVAGTDVNGFGLYASTSISTFSDGFFTVSPSRSGITIDGTTINTNPAEQYYRIGFATTSPGAASNVTLSGSASSFVWFRDGTGGLYGENFDNGDANPGSIRFDDSSNSIIVSGTVYADDGVTTMGGPTCDGSTLNVRIVVNGGSYASSTSCSGVNGSYSFPTVNYVGDPKIVVYLDTNGGAKGSAVTKTPTNNVTNMHIYANRVITRHEDVSALAIVDMVNYDYDNDTDISFIAATTSLQTLANTELFVFASTTFAPGGNITLGGNGNSNSYEGTLQLGANATFSATGTETHTLAGRLVLATTSVLTSASSTFVFNATTTGKSITSPNTITLNDVDFNGAGGGWNITANLSVLGEMDIDVGTVTGTGNITMINGGINGNGTLSLGAGTVTIYRNNTLGGANPWTFYNLTLGSGSIVGTTTMASNATTTVSGLLTISNAHFLNAGGTTFDLAGTGTVFTETGTFIEATSTMRFSGASSNVNSTGYYNLLINAGAGSPTYTGIGSGFIVYNDLTVGGTASTTFTLNTNDPVVEVRGDVLINSNGTLQGSNSANLTVLGDWDNNGTFVGNSGTVLFTTTGTSNIAAGNSSFSNVTINGSGNFVITEPATTTAAMTLTNHANFTVNSGQTLAVGGQFTNTLGGGATTWSSSTLYLYGSGTYSINASTTNDVYHTLVVGAGTQIRMWNSSATTYSVNSTGSLYSQDHSGIDGDLYIYGRLVRSSGTDFWSYATDFDGTTLASARGVDVYLASGASVLYNGATLNVIGSSTATTTLQNQGSGTYSLTIGTGATTNWSRAQIRDINSSGVVFAGTPTVTDFSYTDHLVEINSASAITVGGTVIDANQAKNFSTNIFNDDIGVTGAINVTATGTTVSSWRFTNHTGDIAGEGFDSDPDDNPGYLVWDDSAALVTVSGVVYSDEGVTLSTVCDGVTNNIRLVVAGLTTYDTTCTVASSSFSIPNVAFSPLDTLTLFINGETEKAANVTVGPISSISNMHLYHNRVIVRHENTNPMTIADMAVYDSSDDSDIPFTAVNAGTDTLTVNTDHKLIIWTGKTFTPGGNVTLTGAGTGNSYDGTLEAQSSASFVAQGTESHSVWGSVIFGAGATLTSASSTLTLTSTSSGRTLDVNANNLHNLTLSGAGSYNFTDSTMTLTGTYSQSAGTATFPTGTTTIGAGFNVTSGSFVNNGSPFVFNGSGAGSTVRFNGSNVASLRFSGSGSWSMTDTNATSSGSVLFTGGTATLPSGSLAVGGNFIKSSGNFTHNTVELVMTATTSATLTASGTDLHAVNFAGPATFSITDTNITFLDAFTVSSGTISMASGTTAVGSSFVSTGGSFTHATGTVLLNSGSVGRTLNPGSSTFYNLQISAPSGGYTMHSATTTNNFTLSSANTLTMNTGARVVVGGVFSNSVGGAATTWTNSTLVLNGQNSYSINSRSNSGDVYGTLELGANSDIRMWYSSAGTTTVASSSSLYSQDHANVNGNLYIYGDLVIATTTEYWSYATDFDGTSLTGSERRVLVYNATNSTTTVTTGTLNIIGVSASTTNIENQGSGTYSLIINGGTLNANYFSFSDLNASGLQLLGLSTISDLQNGAFELAVNAGSLISLSSTTLNANPSKIFDNVGFSTTTSITGYNINLTGETSNAWRFTNNYGNLGTEAFDVDGVDACGSIRFDDSSCLLTEQTHYRWRNDDGGEGGLTSEWLDTGFTYRQRVRVLNEDSQSYASTAIKVAVPYDASMQSNFSDLRFTSDNGTTQVPFWVERYTASTDATVWVRVPTVATSTYTSLFMYYGSSTATSTSSGVNTFSVFDDFEDNNITEYSGDTTLFKTDSAPVFGGSYALEANNINGRTTNTLYRTDQTTQQGQIIRWRQYVSTDGDDACTLFAVGGAGANYSVCLIRFGTDRMSIVEDVNDSESSGTVHSSTTVTYSTGWYEVEVDWRTNNSIKAYLYNSSGSLVASTTATDSTRTSGGLGFSFWINNGSWDSYTARPLGPRTPSVYLGAEQTYGGATWAAAQDTAGNALPGDKFRLRMAIENSGLDITGQLFRLEYAPKGASPTCESVSGSAFATVPNQASCASSAVCMATSTNVTDGDNTTDHLTGTVGTFTPGEIVTSPSNQSVSLDIDQDYYIELEYVVTPTANATDTAYCLRTTNAGTELDYYAKVAELTLQFDPAFGTASLNNGADISLTPGTTTIVIASSTVTDLNGYTDLTHATATIYRSGAGAACTANSNDCYIASTENGGCSFTSCSGNSCLLQCTANMYFFADPTDAGTYIGEEWLSYMEVEDSSESYDFVSALGIELLTLRAITVDSLIDYGSLTSNSDTGSYNATTTVENLGNVAIDVDLEGTDLTDGGTSVIPTTNQKVATSTFTYSACVACLLVPSVGTPVELGLVLTKPNVPTPPVEDDVYWGISIPYAVSNSVHNGINIFTPISP